MYAVEADGKRFGDQLNGMPRPHAQRKSRQAKRNSNYQSIVIHGFAFKNVHGDRHAMANQD